MLTSAVYQKYFLGRYLGLVVFFANNLGRGLELSYKIVVNLVMTFDKLHCKGEPYRFNGYIHKDKHTKDTVTSIKQKYN